MGKTVTFSFSSTKYEGTEATETFTLKKLVLMRIWMMKH